MRVGFGWAFGVMLLSCGSVSDGSRPVTGSGGTGGSGGTAEAGAAGTAGLELAGAAGELPSECGPTDADPANCGRCGEVCPLGACSEGQCVDVPEVSLVARAAPAQIVGDGRYLYWMSTEVTLDVGPYTVIVRCSVDGCPEGPQPVTGVDQVSPFAVADGFFTLLSRFNGASGVTRRCVATECISEFSKLGNSTPEDLFEFFSVDAASLAHATSKGAFISPLAGSIVGPSTLLFGSVDYTVPIALSAEHLLAVSYDADQRSFPASCSLAGCDGQPTPLGPPAQYPPLVSANGSDAFWLDRGTSPPPSNTFQPTEFHDGGIYSCPLTGCESPVQLVAFDEWYPGTALAVDETDVYFTAAAPGDSTSASLVRCARTGCGNEPTELARINDVGSRPSIVLDDENVYWVDYAVGSILKRAK